MVFYFSGTGNSKWVAEQIAAEIGEKTVDIAQLVKDRTKDYSVSKNEKVGFVFPVFAWTAPQIVIEFAKIVKRNPDTYTFAVCTCGDEAGYTIEKFAKVVPLNSGYSIVMPNNYILGFNVDEDTIVNEKINHAKSKIKEIAQNILQEKNIFEIKKGKMPSIKSNVFSYFFNKFGRNSKPFNVEENCNSCGICVKHCPTGNIELIEGKPKWEKNCTMCMSCINRCPQRAIQYGSGTKQKGRYYFGMNKE